MKAIRTLAITATLWAGALSAQAALVNRGGGMIYDTELNITWLQNWNQGAGSSYDNGISSTDGRMTWDNARAWADDLVWGGFSDWRLPTMIDTGTAGCDLSYGGGTDCGYNVQTKSGSTVYSEMAHLYYETLGNLSYCPPGDATCAGGPQPGWGLVNTGPFTNMQSGIYLSGLEYEPFQQYVWAFVTLDGYQSFDGKQFESYAVAVRPGDVAASVPEPQTLVLVTLAMGTAVFVRRRRTL